MKLRTLDPRDAAPLADAGLTSYHAVKRSLPALVPGATAVVIGVSGLGHMGVQLLHANGGSRRRGGQGQGQARAGAAERRRRRPARRRRRGGRDPRDHARAGREVVIDFVGADQTLALASEVARPLGHVTIVGLADGTFQVSFFGTPYECSVATTYWGSVPEFMELLDLAEAGRVHVETERFPLDRALEAYDRLRAGTINGRAVITAHG